MYVCVYSQKAMIQLKKNVGRGTPHLHNLPPVNWSWVPGEPPSNRRNPAATRMHWSQHYSLGAPGRCQCLPIWCLKCLKPHEKRTIDVPKMGYIWVYYIHYGIFMHMTIMAYYPHFATIYAIMCQENMGYPKEFCHLVYLQDLTYTVSISPTA